MADSEVTSVPAEGEVPDKNNAIVQPTTASESANDAAQQAKVKKRNANRRTPDLNAVLKTCKTDPERIEALKNNYDALYRKYESFREKHANCKSVEADSTAAKKECDTLRLELTKTQQVKGRLELLCRELQKSNREVREEAIASSKRDEERRNEVTAKFAATIDEVQARSDDIVKRNSDLETERIQYAAKLDGLIADYSKIQSDITEKETRWRAHEEALLKQLECERALSTQEKNVLTTQLEVEKHKLSILEAREGELHVQLKSYATRYDEIEGSLRQSAETVAVFRSEIAKASKAIQSIQRENESLKNANMKLALDKLELERQKQILDVKVAKLESLCRAMQKIKLADAAKTDGAAQSQKADVNEADANGTQSHTPQDNASANQPTQASAETVSKPEDDAQVAS